MTDDHRGKSRTSGLHHEERGSGDETLVWLPGFGQALEVWDGIIPAFARYRSILFDLPGHGESKDVAVEPDIPGFANEVFAAIEELGLERFTASGLLARGCHRDAHRARPPRPRREVDRRRPVAGRRAGAVDENLDGFAAVHGDLEALTAGCAALAVKQPPRSGTMATVMRDVPEDIWHGWLLRGTRISQADELSQVQVPVTYILGTADTVVPLHLALEDIAAIPNARAVVLGGVGHLGAYEFPDLIAKDIASVLAGAPR